MIRADVINGKAVGLVGWKQPTQSTFAIVSADNLASSSGLYYGDASGLVTIENIKASIADQAITNDNFNTLLGDLAKSTLNAIANKLFTKDDFIENKSLFYRPMRYNDEISLGYSAFVGYEIELCDNFDLAVVLNQITLEFAGAGTIKLLLFNSGQLAAVSTKSVTTQADTQVVTDLGWILDQRGAYKGGKWYIGYLTSGLTVNPIARQYQSSNLQNGFGSCYIRPVRVMGWNEETLFDIEDVEYVPDTWGINLDISAFQDYTQLVLRNLNRFAKALQLGVAVRVLDIISTSTTSNRVERLSKNHALLELNGNRNNESFPEMPGILSQFTAEMKRLDATYNGKPFITQAQL